MDDHRTMLRRLINSPVPSLTMSSALANSTVVVGICIICPMAAQERRDVIMNYACMYAHMCVCICMCVYVYVCECVHVMQQYMYMCLCILTYIYTHNECGFSCCGGTVLAQ